MNVSSRATHLGSVAISRHQTNPAKCNEIASSAFGFLAMTLCRKQSKPRGLARLWRGFDLRNTILITHSRFIPQSVQTDPPGPVGPVRAFRISYSLPSPRLKSSIKSSLSSIPIERRIKPSVIPSLARVSGSTEACVMIAGWSTRDSTPPSDLASSF